jgi:hypothetical protein
MRALTLWRPWDSAILYLGKPVENRDWPPPMALIGQRIALHSGKKFDLAGAEFCVRTAIDQGVSQPLITEVLERAERVDSAILGTVRLARIIRKIDVRELPPHQMGFPGAVALSLAQDPLQASPWFFGDFGWVVDELIPFKEPVPCKGAQGLWTLPIAVEAAVLAQEAAHAR